MGSYFVDSDSINIHFGEVVRAFREGRGYSQEAFAARCGISRAYYGRIERGEYNVTLRHCRKIADAFGLRVCDLFEQIPE